MKKTFLALGMLVALAPLAASADTLTKSDAATIAAKLSPALSSISIVVPSYLSLRYAEQQGLMNNYSKQLSNFSATLQSGQASQQDLNDMSQTLVGMNVKLQAVANWRSSIDSILSNMVSTLSQISVSLASVV